MAHTTLYHVYTCIHHYVNCNIGPTPDCYFLNSIVTLHTEIRRNVICSIFKFQTILLRNEENEKCEKKYFYSSYWLNVLEVYHLGYVYKKEGFYLCVSVTKKGLLLKMTLFWMEHVFVVAMPHS